MDKLNENDLDFETYYNLHSKSLRDISLRSFQFKILHRILPTNKLLFKMKINNYSLCDFCNSYIETLEHLFWECGVSRNIWIQVNDNLRLSHKFDNFNIDLKTIMLGYINENENFIFGINIFIVLIKKYIFNCKIHNKILSFEGVKNYIKNEIKFQRMSMGGVDEWEFLSEWL